MASHHRDPPDFGLVLGHIGLKGGLAPRDLPSKEIVGRRSEFHRAGLKAALRDGQLPVLAEALDLCGAKDHVKGIKVALQLDSKELPCLL